MDQRKAARKKLMAFTPVYTTSPRTLLGYLGDLTTHGALVVGEKSVEVNAPMTLSIVFPSDMDDIPSAPLTLSGRVARCVRDESPNYFNIGVEFGELLPGQVKVIEAIIRRYQFHRDLPA